MHTAASRLIHCESKPESKPKVESELKALTESEADSLAKPPGRVRSGRDRRVRGNRTRAGVQRGLEAGDRRGRGGGYHGRGAAQAPHQHLQPALAAARLPRHGRRARPPGPPLSDLPRRGGRGAARARGGGGAGNGGRWRVGGDRVRVQDGASSPRGPAAEPEICYLTFLSWFNKKIYSQYRYVIPGISPDSQRDSR